MKDFSITKEEFKELLEKINPKYISNILILRGDSNSTYSDKLQYLLLILDKIPPKTIFHYDSSWKDFVIRYNVTKIYATIDFIKNPKSKKLLNQILSKRYTRVTYCPIFSLN